MPRLILAQWVLALMLGGCIQEYSPEYPECPCGNGWRCCLPETGVNVCVKESVSCHCSGLIGEINLTPEYMTASGSEMAEVVVWVFDVCAGKRPQGSIEVLVHSSRNHGNGELDHIEQPTGPTTADGMAVAYISSSVPGEATLSATAGSEPLCKTWEGTECIEPAKTTITFVQ